ncbi:MAG: MFS transporter [Chloroflexota bacterium]
MIAWAHTEADSRPLGIISAVLPIRRPPELGGLISLTMVSFAFGALSPALEEIQQVFGGGAQVAALLVAGFSAGRLMAGFPAGLLVDRVGPGRVILAGSVTFLAGALVALLSTGLWMLVLGRVIQGIGLALVPAGVLGRLMAAAADGRAGGAMALYQGAITLGSAIGPALGGPAATFIGWRGGLVVCVVAGVVAVFAAIGSARTYTPPRAKQQQARATFGWLAALALLVVLLPNIVTGMYRFAVGLLALPLYATGPVGLDPTSTGLLLGSQGLITVVMLAPGGRACDRWGVRRVGIVSSAAIIVAIASFPSATTSWALWGSALLYGMSLSVLGVAAGAFIFTLKGFSTGTLVGMYRLSYDTVQVLSPLLVGLLLDAAGFSLSFYTLAAAGGLSLFALMSRMRQTVK